MPQYTYVKSAAVQIDEFSKELPVAPVVPPIQKLTLRVPAGTDRTLPTGSLRITYWTLEEKVGSPPFNFNSITGNVTVTKACRILVKIRIRINAPADAKWSAWLNTNAPTGIPSSTRDASGNTFVDVLSIFDMTANSIVSGHFTNNTGGTVSQSVSDWVMEVTVL